MGNTASTHQKKRIFLSYRRSQADFARSMKMELEGLGYQVFFDLDRDSGLGVGKFQDQLKKTLASTDVVLVLITPAPSGPQHGDRFDMSSTEAIEEYARLGWTDWCAVEVETALELDKMVIPVYPAKYGTEWIGQQLSKLKELPNLSGLCDLMAYDISDSLFKQSVAILDQHIQRKMKDDAKSAAAPSPEQALCARKSEGSGYDDLVKCILIGDSGVGKTQVKERICGGEFQTCHNLTIGVTFGTRTVEYKREYQKWEVWDTAGQERFRSITSSYYRGAGVIVFVYDCTVRETFNNVQHWVEEATGACRPDTPMFLLANKIDLESSRTVSECEGLQFARDHGMHHFQVSAKTNMNIAIFLQKLAARRHVFRRDEERSKFQRPKSNSFKLGDGNPTKKKECPCTIM